MTPDIIIVGAGAAGCVLAERLSADLNRKVLLIEAGGWPSNPFVHVPAGFAKLFRSTCDWAFEGASGLGGRPVFTPRGRVVGGSTALNAQIHQWGCPQDFEAWARAGATGWTWDAAAEAFCAIERAAFGETHRGHAGALNICINAAAHPGAHAFVTSARAAILDIGAACAKSYNGGAHEGAWISEITHEAGRRVTAADAFLKPALGRPNLQVLTGAHVTAIDIEGGRAVGVRYEKVGARVVKSRDGVVLAAGAFGSPVLLMRSGIGPGANLQKYGVPIVRAMEGVGADLQDHPMAVLNFATHRKDTMKSAESPQHLWRYLTARQGPLASNVAEAVAFARSAPDVEAADIELIFAPVEWRAQALESPRTHAFAIGAIVLAPRSRGSVRLSGPDPSSAPQIDFALLSDPGGHDRGAMHAAIALARRVAAEPALGAMIAREIEPGPASMTPEELTAWMREAIQTVYHPCGTCRMGTDAQAVVTPQLAVRGVSGLWVADASVMPRVPRGHPCAVVSMIAWRGAEMIARSIGGARQAAAA